jgi:hypothetical protein
MHAILPVFRTPLLTVASVVVLVVAIAAQFQSWPLHAVYDAATLEGTAAANAIDETTGARVRVADAARGARPVVLLPDTFLPRGALRLTAQLRMIGTATEEAIPVARVALVQLDGRAACVNEVHAAHLALDRFTDVNLLCELDRDGPATLAVFSLGEVDLSIDKLHLSWTR